MDWLSFKTRREPGFRLNIPDLIYLGLTLWLSGWLFHRFPNTSLYGLPLYIVFTFFLFCNVFRIGNLLEALWYLPFSAACVYYLRELDFQALWLAIVFIFEPWKWLLIIWRIIRGPYIGLGYKTANTWFNREGRVVI